MLKGFLGALSGLASLVWVGTGAVLFWRAANDRMALFVSFALVMFGPAVFGVAPDSIRSIADLIATLWSNASFVLLVVLFYTFPNGRFVPRWTLPLVVVWTVVVIAPLPFLLDSNEPRPSWVAELEAIVYLVGFGGPVVAQIYRYRRVYNAVQRQQAKWVVAGIAAVLVGVPGTYAVLESQPVLFLLVGTPVVILSISLIPLSIAVSILRYRLWDIDVLINRVLVYSLLTAALGLTYLAGVVVLQAAFRALTGQESTVALVGSTLAIAALFQPVRVRLQQLIDRRFYRRKYDAARTLEAFAETVRDQVDIDRLSDELVGDGGAVAGAGPRIVVACRGRWRQHQARLANFLLSRAPTKDLYGAAAIGKRTAILQPSGAQPCAPTRGRRTGRRAVVRPGAKAEGPINWNSTPEGSSMWASPFT